MTEGSVLRPVLKLSALFAIGSFLNLVPFVVDRRFVGQVGTDALAALGIANAALMVLVTFALGMALGTLDLDLMVGSSAIGRLVRADEIAAAVAFLAGGEASAITGVNLPVDGGYLVATPWAGYGGLRRPA
jgi:Na+-driven multidrug efflux pump